MNKPVAGDGSGGRLACLSVNLPRTRRLIPGDRDRAVGASLRLARHPRRTRYAAVPRHADGGKANVQRELSTGTTGHIQTPNPWMDAGAVSRSCDRFMVGIARWVQCERDGRSGELHDDFFPTVERDAVVIICAIRQWGLERPRSDLLTLFIGSVRSHGLDMVIDRVRAILMEGPRNNDPRSGDILSYIQFYMCDVAQAVRAEAIIRATGTPHPRLPPESARPEKPGLPSTHLAATPEAEEAAKLAYVEKIEEAAGTGAGWESVFTNTPGALAKLHYQPEAFGELSHFVEMVNDWKDWVLGYWRFTNAERLIEYTQRVRTDLSNLIELRTPAGKAGEFRSRVDELLEKIRRWNADYPVTVIDLKDRRRLVERDDSKVLMLEGHRGGGWKVASCRGEDNEGVRAAWELINYLMGWVIELGGATKATPAAVEQTGRNNTADLGREAVGLLAERIGSEPKLLWLKSYLDVNPNATTRDIESAANSMGHGISKSRVNDILRRNPWIGHPARSRARAAKPVDSRELDRRPGSKPRR